MNFLFLSGDVVMLWLKTPERNVQSLGEAQIQKAYLIAMVPVLEWKSRGRIGPGLPRSW
jgi:hypothetical protein